MKRPSFQFYPSDWLRDTALRTCSVGARGLWMDMICFMHQGNPYGHLRVSYKDILPTILGGMVGADLKDTQTWLQELEEAGVFQRTESGTIFSKRMIRDEEIRNLRAKGGGKSLENPNVPRPKEGYPPRTTFDPSLGVSPSSSSSSSYSIHTEEFAMNGLRKGTMEGFPAFWETYPRTMAKRKCEKIWRDLQLDKKREEIIGILRVQMKSESWTKENGKFIPSSKTWLEEERWNDGTKVKTEFQPQSTEPIREAMKQEAIKKHAEWLKAQEVKV